MKPTLVSARRRKLLGPGLVALTIATAVVLFTLVHLKRAADHALGGKTRLLSAEIEVRAGRFTSAQADLRAAEADFLRAGRVLRGLGPVRSLALGLPIVGDQVRGAEALAATGVNLVAVGLRLTDAVRIVAAPVNPDAELGTSLNSLRATREPLEQGIASLDAVSVRLATLERYHLLGPLARARNDLSRRLGPVKAKAESAADGIEALLLFAGGSGPRRFLFLSQNPDEVRPTGGFIGTYGVVTADGGRLAIERYEDIADWTTSHPAAVVPSEQAVSPFRFYVPAKAQNLANVNSVADWPRAAELATELWRLGGEQPVDGVLAVTPGFLARVLRVIGPVTVAVYGDTVTADNVVERLDYHTHLANPQSPDRKDFVAAAAEAVLRQLLVARSSQWEALGRAIGDSFDAREALAWFVDSTLQLAVAARGWDGVLPDTPGDFLYTAEFSYAAKNGRGLQRTYDHDVVLRADGSARITTTITISNRLPPDPNSNPSSLGYIVLYGPQGAIVDRVRSDPPALEEPPLGGHPAVGWFRAAEPLSQTSLTVAWDAPTVARKSKDGTLRYDLRLMRLPDHLGDILQLRVHTPPGWRWIGSGPPSATPLDRDVVGSWSLAPPKRGWIEAGASGLCRDNTTCVGDLKGRNSPFAASPAAKSGWAGGWQ